MVPHASSSGGEAPRLPLWISCFDTPCVDYGALKRAVDSACQPVVRQMGLIASATIGTLPEPATPHTIHARAALLILPSHSDLGRLRRWLGSVLFRNGLHRGRPGARHRSMWTTAHPFYILRAVCCTYPRSPGSSLLLQST